MNHTIYHGSEQTLCYFLETHLLNKEMSQRRRYYLVFLICSIFIYELPYFLTLLETGWTQLPPVLSSDQRLYLNLSNIQRASATQVVNPWYGNVVPAIDVTHLRFPVTFILFRLAHRIFGSWTASMLVWTAILAALTFIAAVFFLDSLFPNSDYRLTVTGAFGLLVLQSPLTYAADIMQLPSLKGGFFDLALPYSRFPFPQVAVPIVFTYLGLQARALESGSNRLLVGMAFLQFAAFATFPYFLPAIAIGTAIAFSIVLPRGRENWLSWKSVLTFGAVCGAMDIAYALLAGLGKSHGNLQFALHFRPEMILPSLRTYVVLLLVASGLALLSRVSLAAKTTVAGFAISIALFAFSDAFFPATAMMLGHINYLIAFTTWLPLVVVIWPWLEKLNGRALRVALNCVLIFIGLWEGFSNYHSNLPFDIFQGNAAQELDKLALTPKDLVVAPAYGSDDISCFVPLLSRAKVLFTRDAENVLTAQSIRGEQAFRQAIYLELGGINYDSLISLTEPGSQEAQVTHLALFGEIGYVSSPLPADHAKIRGLERARLGPMLAQLDSDPASARYLFEGYDRIIVIDSSSEPVFKASALSPWLELKQAYERNGVRIWICQPKLAT